MSQINVVGKTKFNLGEDKWFANSGVIVGDVSVPATIELINIPNTGLRNAYVKIKPFYGKEVNYSQGNQLGIIVKINDIEIIKTQNEYESRIETQTFELFIPYQSKLEIISLNTSANNTQERGVSVLGWLFG
tara:strand:+ start:521 stop:916 length:396 start_codon:yes stop_codon:yes gene_type:complete